MKAIKKILSILLRVAISIALLAVLFCYVDLRDILHIIRHVDIPLLVLAFFVFTLNYIACLFRWQMILKAVDIRLPLKRVIISFSGGVFFNLFLPSTIGGDLMRSIDLAAHTRKPGEVVATVFLDRLSGYVGLVLLTLGSLAFGWKLIEDKAVLLAIGIISGLLFVLLFVLFNNFIYTKTNSLLRSPRAGKIREIITQMHEEIHIFRHHKRIIVENISISLFIQAISPLTFYIIGLSLGLKLSPIYYFVFMPIIGAIALLPISIGGLGLRDATTVYFFSKVAVGKELAMAMSLINFSFIIICGALGGLIYVLTVHHRRLQPHSSPPVS